MARSLKRTKRTTKRYSKAVGKSRTARQSTVSKMRGIVKKEMNRVIESKNGLHSSTDGVEILHNNFVTLTSAILSTTQGTNDPENNSTGNRIGDQIILKGVNMKFMLELNERYSDVTFRILVVKCARGDTPTRALLFNNLSGNKMMDTINTERYSILAQKYVKLTARNHATRGADISLAPLNAGTYNVNQAANEELLSRATKIVSMNIKGTKFGRGGKIQYDTGGTMQKFFDYHVLCYAYSNYSTSQDIFNVGRVNEFYSRMTYKDA